MTSRKTLSQTTLNQVFKEVVRNIVWRDLPRKSVQQSKIYRGRVISGFFMSL